MRSHWFTNGLLCLIVHRVPKEGKAKENDDMFKFFLVIFIGRHHMAQVIHFKGTGSHKRKQTCYLYCLYNFFTFR